MLKKAFSILLIAMVLMLSACGSSDNLVGSWDIKDVQTDGSSEGWAAGIALFSALGGKMQMVFENNGKGYLMVSNPGTERKQEFSWKLDGKKIVMDGTSYGYTLSGDTLTMDVKGKVIMERSK